MNESSETPASIGAGLALAVDPRYDLKTLRALRRIIRAVDLHSHRLYDEHRLTTPQLVCLLTIQDGEPIVQRQLAERVQLSASTMVGILDRLEDRGLVRRRRDGRDRRLVYVTLTAAGRALVAAAPSPLQDRLAAALKRLPESEQQAITAALERVVDLMEVSHLDAAPILEAGALDAGGRRTPPAGIAPVASLPPAEAAAPARPAAPIAPTALIAPIAPATATVFATPAASAASAVPGGSAGCPIDAAAGGTLQFSLPSAPDASETMGEPPRGPQGLTDGAAMARPDPPPSPQANDSRPQ